MPASIDNIFFLLLTPAYTTGTVVLLAGVEDAFSAGVIMSLILRSNVVSHSHPISTKEGLAAPSG